MQPKFKMKKTLLASALIMGLGNAFHASSETFTVSAGAIPDVSVVQNSTLGTLAGTELSFGTSVKLTPTAGSTCTVLGASRTIESDLDVNLDGDDGTNDFAITTQLALAASTDVFGQVTGNGCIADVSGTPTGSTMVFDIDGADTSSVTVSIPDVVGTGWTYSPGAESCVTKFDRGAGVDTCETFSGKNTVTGVLMAEAEGTEEATGGSGLGGVEGRARLLLAGTLTFDGTDVSAPAGEVVTVTVTYE
jgi:hypothetical protein